VKTLPESIFLGVFDDWFSALSRLLFGGWSPFFRISSIGAICAFSSLPFASIEARAAYTEDCTVVLMPAADRIENLFS